MLLFAVDLIVFVCLLAQFAIAGYFLYLIYWLWELPPDQAAEASLPGDLPRVLIQIPVYNEPLVVERAVTTATHDAVCVTVPGVAQRWCDAVRLRAAR